MKSDPEKQGKEFSPTRLAIQIVGFLLLPLVWIFLKNVVHVTDRYIPSISSVFSSVNDIEPNVFVHFAYTVTRFVGGFLLGVAVGIIIGVWMFRFSWLFDLLMPSIQSTRAVPAIAIIPFFILWFGFSEFGRYLLVIAGTSFNIAVATYQIIKSIPEKHLIMFKSFGVRPERMIIRYGLPRVAEELLPTLRFSLSTAIGLIIASELLGSQIGLGYLIQTSQSTFSLHVVFLVTIMLGITNVMADWLLKYSWSKLVFWRKI